MSEQLFILGECEITLYPANEADAPATSTPVFAGYCPEQLNVSERWEAVVTRPAGRRNPKHHPLVAGYEIQIDRKWVLQSGGSPFLKQLRTDRRRYVLDFLHTDQENGDWHRWTFYGVTISARNWESDGVYEYKDRQTFDAEYYEEASGQGTPPTVSLSEPLTVRYISATGVATALYTYNTTTHAFAETSAGISTGKATVLHNPNQTGDFEVTFSGAGSPALEVTAAGVLHAATLVEGAPNLTDQPRVDFLVGNVRVASITAAGRFYVPLFIEAAPVSAASHFEIFAGSALAALIGGTGTTAATLTEP